MKKFKLQDEVPKQDPSKYKDFGKLVTNYESTLHRLHKKPLYKDPKAFLFLVVIILITLLIFEAVEKDKKKDDQQQQQQDQNVNDLKSNVNTQFDSIL